MKTKIFSRIAWSFAAFVAGIGLFAVGYSHGHSDATMSATEVTIAQLRTMYSQWGVVPPDKTRADLLRAADHAFMLNAETHELGPLLSGLLIDRKINADLMQRYAQYRGQQVAFPVGVNPQFQHAAKTFSN